MPFFHFCLLSCLPHRSRRSVIYTPAVELVSMELSILEKPSAAQLLKNFQTFYGTRKFITVFTRGLCTGPNPTPDQASPYYPILSKTQTSHCMSEIIFSYVLLNAHYILRKISIDFLHFHTFMLLIPWLSCSIILHYTYRFFPSRKLSL
jgi:hypothetical protein